MQLSISLKDIQKAQTCIAPWIHNSGLKPFRTLSEKVNHLHNRLHATTVYLKMENEQVTGSFKIRGALNKVLNLSKAESTNFLVSCSVGNHAQGLAYAASRVGSFAQIVVPRQTPQVKKQAICFYGGKVVEYGQVYDESYKYAKQLCEEKSGTFIHPYLDPLVIAGQGSIGLEIVKEIPDVDSVIVPIGGGGLIGGIATAIKAVRPQCRIYGVVSEMSPAMHLLFKGKVYEESGQLLEHGLADGIHVKTPSLEMLNIYIKPYVEDIAIVREQELASALIFLLERAKTLVEGAGAASVAALLKVSTKKWNLGKKCVAILSGGNIDLYKISQVINELKSTNR